MKPVSNVLSFKNVVPPLAVLALAVPAVVTQDFSKVEIQHHPVAGSVHYLQGRGGNIGVSVGEDGVLIVDSQFSQLAPKIEAALKQLSDKPVAFLLNTHWHGDHTGGNRELGKSGAIIAHTNVRRRLAAEDGIEGRKAEEVVPEGLPVVTFEDSLSLHFNGEEIQLLHFPNAHTDGDSVVYFTGSKVIHMGDLFFAGRFPYIDLDSGGSVDGLIDAVGGILGNLSAETQVIPGHGPLTGIDELRLYLGMLTDCRRRVLKALESGQSLADMKSADLLNGYESWGTGFIKTERFLEILARDLDRGGR